MSRSNLYLGTLEQITNNAYMQMDYTEVLSFFYTDQSTGEFKQNKIKTITPSPDLTIEQYVTTHSTEFKQFTMGVQEFVYNCIPLIVEYKESDFDDVSFGNVASANAIKALTVNMERAMFSGVDVQSATFNFGFNTSPNVTKPAQITPTTAKELFDAINKAYVDVKGATQSNSLNIAMGGTNGIRLALDTPVSGGAIQTYLEVLEGRYGNFYTFEDFVYGDSGIGDFFMISNPSQVFGVFGKKPFLYKKPYDDRASTEIWQFGRTTGAINCTIPGAAQIQTVDVSGITA